MPKYVIPEVSDYDFLKIVQTRTENKDFKFDPKSQVKLLAYLGNHFKLDTIDASGIITEPRKKELVGRFKNFPKSLRFQIAEVDDFITRVNALATHLPPDNPGPPDVKYELGLRFYIGLSLLTGWYSVVVVPMYVPRINDIYERTLEKEISFFIAAGSSFFALLGSDSSTGISTDQTVCASRISVKDSYNREVAYYPFKDFMTFKNSLSMSPDYMQIEFARVSDGFVTVVLSFLDSAGSEIESSDPLLGKGAFFDQGDLIPPPPADGVLRDTFFPR